MAVPRVTCDRTVDLYAWAYADARGALHIWTGLCKPWQGGRFCMSIRNGCLHCGLTCVQGIRKKARDRERDGVKKGRKEMAESKQQALALGR